jgi:hypothetical protein
MGLPALRLGLKTRCPAPNFDPIVSIDAHCIRKKDFFRKVAFEGCGLFGEFYLPICALGWFPNESAHRHLSGDLNYLVGVLPPEQNREGI